jgi:hypothetical protein
VSGRHFRALGVSLFSHFGTPQEFLQPRPPKSLTSPVTIVLDTVCRAAPSVGAVALGALPDVAQRQGGAFESLCFSRSSWRRVRIAFSSFSTQRRSHHRPAMVAHISRPAVGRLTCVCSRSISESAFERARLSPRRSGCGEFRIASSDPFLANRTAPRTYPSDSRDLPSTSLIRKILRNLLR